MSGVLRRKDVPVGNDWDGEGFLHRADDVPVRLASVHLGLGAPMDGYGVCSGGLQHLAEFHSVYVPHVPALSSLDRHGDPTPSLHRFHNASRFVRILHQCAAVSAVGHLGHGTAHIDVDDVRLFQLHDLGRRLLHAHHIAAEQLDGGGVFIRRQRHDAAGLFVLIA